MTEKKETKMEDIISLCKRRGFVYQGSEIYGGLAGTWDYGPLGVALKKNIENIWWKRFVDDREDIYPVDASILMNQEVWKASGHVGGFSDPLVEDLKTKKRIRADHKVEELEEILKNKKELYKTYQARLGENNIKIEFVGSLQTLDRKLKVALEVMKEHGIPVSESFGDVRQFNMMFKTHIGAAEDESAVSYLRPETAQGMFVNFKNIIDSFHPSLPFGMAQIGKAFRNEIAPRDFIFRVRELEQMEIEYFVNPNIENSWKEIFEKFQKEQVEFLVNDLGLSKEKIHQIDIKAEDRAHYSKHSVDTEFDFPMGQKELLGLAYRTDYDLKNHSEASKTDLSYFDEENKTRFIPHCIEPTFGLGRLMLAVLSDAYTEDEVNGEKRIYLKIDKKIAPVKVAVFPLLKNKPALVEKAREVFLDLKKKIKGVEFDDNGNIGKRYRRQDEIGTPYCVTVDFDTIEKDNTVTVRNRDAGNQERVKIEDLVDFVSK